MIIRPAIENDADQIDAILRAAFETGVEADLTKALRASGDARLEDVALDGDVIVGCNMLSVLDAPEKCLGLGPIAVTPERQGQGIGGALVRASIKAARDGGWRAIFLLGNPDYYGRFGFSAANAAPFKSAYPPAYMQALPLFDGALDGIGDEMIYAEPFRKL